MGYDESYWDEMEENSNTYQLAYDLIRHAMGVVSKYKGESDLVILKEVLWRASEFVNEELDQMPEQTEELGLDKWQREEKERLEQEEWEEQQCEEEAARIADAYGPVLQEKEITIDDFIKGLAANGIDLDAGACEQCNPGPIRPKGNVRLVFMHHDINLSRFLQLVERMCGPDMQRRMLGKSRKQPWLKGTQLHNFECGQGIIQFVIPLGDIHRLAKAMAKGPEAAAVFASRRRNAG